MSPCLLVKMGKRDGFFLRLGTERMGAQSVQGPRSAPEADGYSLTQASDDESCLGCLLQASSPLVLKKTSTEHSLCMFPSLPLPPWFSRSAAVVHRVHEYPQALQQAPLSIASHMKRAASWTDPCLSSDRLVFQPQSQEIRELEDWCQSNLTRRKERGSFAERAFRVLLGLGIFLSFSACFLVHGFTARG